MTTSKIGVIGLGSMGMGAACSLVKRGFVTQGFDLRSESLASFEAAGGVPAKSPAEAASGVDALFVVVVNAAQLEAALFGPGGATETLPKGAVVIAMPTIPASAAKKLAEKVIADGWLYLDAPMSGGAKRAAEGAMTVMASGSPAAFAKSEASLAAVASKVFRLGDEAGIGSTVKAVNQLLAGVHIATAAEALAFGVKAGADPQTLFDVISTSAGNSWMFENRVPHMLDDDYTPLSAVEIFVKDLGLVLDAGRELRFPLPVAAAAHQQFLAASGAGWGGLDDSAVVKVYETLSGVEVKRK